MKYSFAHGIRTIQPVPGFIEELKAAIPGDATRFLEWGAGCSTLLFQEIARERKGTSFTVEDDPNFLVSVGGQLDFPGSEIVLADLTGPRFGQDDKGLNYGTYPTSKGVTYDVILIDGRRRVECAVVALALSHPGTVILLHDYRRSRYQVLSRLFKFHDGPQFRRLLPK